MSDYVEHLDNVLRTTGEKLLQGAGTVSHAQEIEKATEEYKKYHVQNLSPVEEEYLESIKNIHSMAKKKRRSNSIELCSYASDEDKKLCLHSSLDTHRMCGENTKETYLGVLCFLQFYRHFVFVEDEEGNRKKRLEKYFEVSVVVDVGGDTRNFI